MPISARLADLGELARRGGRLAQSIRGTRGSGIGFARELKKDGSIVTQADRQIEQMLREELPKLVPGTTVWGEEYGPEEEGPGGLWVVDPVDGTSNFSYGSPLWGVSIGLIVGDGATLGAIYLPDLDELYLAERGEGAYMNGESLSPLPSGPIRPEELLDYSDGVLKKIGFGNIPGKMRTSGAFVIAGSFTFTQRFRGLIGHKEQLYDIGASLVIGGELGADIRYVNGDPFDIVPLKKPRQIGRPWLIFPPDSGFLAEG